MAVLAPWPPYARIARDYEGAAANDVLRSQLDDGAVQQRRIYTRQRVTRDIEVDVRGPWAPHFEAWLHDSAADYFLARDRIAGQWRRMRVVGGAGGARWSQVASLGDAHYTVALQLEGDAAPVPAAGSLWDVPIGDASHVYLRTTATAACVSVLEGGREKRSINIGGLDHPPLGMLPGWMFSAAATEWWWLNEIRFRRANWGPVQHSVRLHASPAPAPRTTAEARRSWISDAVRSGLSLAMRWHATAPPTQTLFVAPAPGRGSRRRLSHTISATIDNLIGGPPGAGDVVVDLALVWTGAGTVIDTAAYRSAGGGARPAV